MVYSLYTIGFIEYTSVKVYLSQEANAHTSSVCNKFYRSYYLTNCLLYLRKNSCNAVETKSVNLK